MIKKIKNKFVVLSETTGRSFGSYATFEEAKKRLRQVEYFKYLSKKPSKKSISTAIAEFRLQNPQTKLAVFFKYAFVFLRIFRYQTRGAFCKAKSPRFRNSAISLRKRFFRRFPRASVLGREACRV